MATTGLVSRSHSSTILQVTGRGVSPMSIASCTSLLMMRSASPRVGITTDEHVASTSARGGHIYCKPVLTSRDGPPTSSPIIYIMTSSLVVSVVTAIRGAQQQLDLEVAAARTAGLSWADIGRAAGMTRQGALSRWGTPAS